MDTTNLSIKERKKRALVYAIILTSLIAGLYFIFNNKNKLKEGPTTSIKEINSLIQESRNEIKSSINTGKEIINKDN